jgi:hypothetical protein
MNLFPPFLCLRIYHNNYNSWYCKKIKFCTYWNEYLRTKMFQRQNITSLWAFSNSTSKSPYNVDHNIYNPHLRAPTSPPLPAPPCSCPRSCPTIVFGQKGQKELWTVSSKWTRSKNKRHWDSSCWSLLSRARSKNDRSTSRNGGALWRRARQKPSRASLARPGTDARILLHACCSMCELALSLVHSTISRIYIFL